MTLALAAFRVLVVELWRRLAIEGASTLLESRILHKGKHGFHTNLTEVSAFFTSEKLGQHWHAANACVGRFSAAW